jgi:hypothetical protein
MIVFGGILDVCKELDDMLMYDLVNKKWVHLFEELMLLPIREKYGALILKHKEMDDHYTLSDPEPQQAASPVQNPEQTTLSPGVNKSKL